jgi:hypothetical protein
MYSRLCPWLFTWSDYGEEYEVMVRILTTPVQTRNISQSVACRVVGMMWVIYAIWYPLLSCELALRGNIKLGHVTNCEYIIPYCNG